MKLLSPKNTAIILEREKQKEIERQFELTKLTALKIKEFGEFKKDIKHQKDLMEKEFEEFKKDIENKKDIITGNLKLLEDEFKQKTEELKIKTDNNFKWELSLKEKKDNLDSRKREIENKEIITKKNLAESQKNKNISETELKLLTDQKIVLDETSKLNEQNIKNFIETKEKYDKMILEMTNNLNNRLEKVRERENNIFEKEKILKEEKEVLKKANVQLQEDRKNIEKVVLEARKKGIEI